MAKITDKKLRGVKERILHKGSFLEKEAYELGISMEELMLALQRMYDGGVRNTQYKAVLNTSAMNSSRVPKEELEQMRILPKPTKNKYSSLVHEDRVSAELLMQEEEEISAEESDEEQLSLDELLDKKEELEGEVELATSSLAKAKEVLGIRKNTLEEALVALQKAQTLVQTVESEVEVAQLAMQQAEERLSNLKVALKEVSVDIEKNTIYLVDPWYDGELPEYGICLSVVERDGVTVHEVNEEYLPKATLEGVLLFDYVPDYKKAREFCGLVCEYELENKPYTLCVSDKRVKDLLEMYVG